VPLAKAERWLQKEYPSIAEWLWQFRDAAIRRQDQGDYWWELRACEYLPAFQKAKIVWPDIAKLPRFSIDTTGVYFGTTAFFISEEDYYLLGVLASWPTWFMIKQICQPLRLRRGRWQFRLKRQFMERIPVPYDIKPADREAIASLARRCNELGPECYRLECEVLKGIRSDLIPGDKKMPLLLQRWWECSFADLKEKVERAGREKLLSHAALSWETRLAKEKEARQAIRTHIESAEAELTERVARTFGLSQLDFRTVMQAVST
jgi:hypothetical protein